MACSSTVAALLHPWSGRLDVASTLPIFTAEFAAAGNKSAEFERLQETAGQKRSRHRSLSINVSLVNHNHGDGMDVVAKLVDEQEMIRSFSPHSIHACM